MKLSEPILWILRGGGGSKGERLSQELIYMNYKMIDKRNVKVAKTLMSRDYKGFSSGFETSNAVIVQEN